MKHKTEIQALYHSNIVPTKYFKVFIIFNYFGNCISLSCETDNQLLISM